MSVKETRGRKRVHQRDENDMYVCETCNKLFKTYFARYIHINRTHKDPAIKCYMEDCNVKFRTHEVRDRHFIIMHALPMLKKGCRSETQMM